jgi:peptidoglycan/LPS O-acetylase OafA/YrhL
MLVIAIATEFAPAHQLWIILAGVMALSILLLVLIDRPLDAWRQTRVREGDRASTLPPAQPAPVLP